MKHFLPGLLLAMALVFSAIGQQPPETAKMEVKEWDQLSNRNISAHGQAALDIVPAKWKHGETENFIFHYRRATEANKVTREIEYDLWFAATTLGFKPSEYGPKSHVFIFEDETEWAAFVKTVGAPEWAASFAHGGELFLEVHDSGSGSRKFDFATLAHETTHAVVFRLYPGKEWPLWMNEGFAEYIGSTATAARKGQYAKRNQRDLKTAGLTPDQLEQLTVYPDKPADISQLYQSGEKLVRYLIETHGIEKFRAFTNEVLSGGHLSAAIMQVYGEEYKTYPDFLKKFALYTH